MVPDIPQFLQEMLDMGKSPSTLRGMVAATKAARVGPRKLTKDCYDLITQFLRGARQVAPPPRRVGVPLWDLELIPVGFVARAVRAFANS